MKRFSCGIVWALALLASAAVDRCAAQAETKIADPKGPRKTDLNRLLFEMVETKPFVNQMTLKDAISSLSEQFAKRGHELTIWLDAAAFKEDSPDAADPLETPVYLPAIPRKMPLATALRQLLSKIPSNNASYLLREGAFVITTNSRAAPAVLLRSAVTARFDKTPLEDALEELSNHTGATILLDPRVGDKARTPVTATLKNTLTLEAAVRLLAEMAELRAVVDNDVLFVTTAARAPERSAKGVRLEFRGRRLDDALRELGEATSTTIVLEEAIRKQISEAHAPLGIGGQTRRTDAAADQSEETPRSYNVTVTFRGDVSVEGATRLLAQMTGLNVMRLDGALYVGEFPWLSLPNPGIGGLGGGVGAAPK